MYGSSSQAITRPPGVTEFDILKASHKFLRDDTDSQAVSWNDQVARKYYESLYREFAVCDLKHYKSGNFALRWRTESEVLSGAGEVTCGNTRCSHHHPPLPDQKTPPLSTLELPFGYQEHGDHKSALVKVVLCGRCVDKLMWKRRKEAKAKVEEGAEENTSNHSSKSRKRGRGREGEQVRRGDVDGVEVKMEDNHGEEVLSARTVEEMGHSGSRRHRRDREDDRDGPTRRSSRSCSPRVRQKGDVEIPRRRRSRSKP